MSTSASDNSASVAEDYRASHTASGKGESYDQAAHHGRHRALMWAWEQRVLASVLKRRLADCVRDALTRREARC